ncbi:unnamed protein product [Fusarium graminearum]|nr:unnamed protein product [Fusarium graminearum]
MFSPSSKLSSARLLRVEKEKVVVDENHKDNDDGVISCSTRSPHFTPKSVGLTADAAQDKQEVPPVSEAPPAPVEEEKVPGPWNAICIVGVRVYSKDEYLELRTCLFICIVFRRSGPVRAQGAYLS